MTEIATRIATFLSRWCKSNGQAHTVDPRDGKDYTHLVQLTYMDGKGGPSRELTLTPALRNGEPVINVTITNPE